MSESPKVLALGYADAHEVVGTSGVHTRWSEHGAKPLGTGRLYRELFGRVDETYRRLDRQSKAIVMATAATGIDALLSDEEREASALVTESSVGSIEVDLRYMDVMRAGFVHGAIFPYTLQSTCIGDVALRHGVRGATVCLSVHEDGYGQALREAARMFAAGEVRHAIVASVDALAQEVQGLDMTLRAVAAVVAAPDADGDSVAPWPDASSDPFAEWAERCRELAST